MTPSLITPLDVLVEARHILVQPGAWTQHVSARNAASKPMSPCRASAVSFCVGGGVLRAEHLLCEGVKQKILHPACVQAIHLLEAYITATLKDNGYCGLLRWNDDPLRIQEHVVTMFDTVIAEQAALETARTPNITA